MNILISSGHYYLSDKYGGEMKWAIDFAIHYAKQGHKVYVVSTVSDIGNKLDRNINIYSLFRKRSNIMLIEFTLRALHPIISGIIAVYIYLLILKGNVAMVHHVSPLSTTSYDLLFLIKPNPQKTTYIFGPALPVPQFGDSKGLSDALSAKYTIYTPFIWKIAKIIFPILERVNRVSTSRADYFVCATKEAALYFNKTITKAQTRIIPIGVENNKLHNRKLSSRSNVVILSACKLIERKGIDVLIRAFADLKPIFDNQSIHAQLRLVGDGDQVTQLKELASDLKISNNVKFVGFVDHFGLYKEYVNADLFCSATRYEPYGMSILEAMSYGLPVVVSDVNSTKEIIGNGGFVFPVDNHVILAKILTVLVSDAKKRIEIGRKASKRISKVFDWNVITKQYLNLLK